MSISKFNSSINFAKVPNKPRVPLKEPEKAPIPDIKESQVKDEAKISDSPFANKKMPKELKALLEKYQKQGCTKEEILSVLEKYNIPSIVDGNKIRFEFNGNQYTLVYTKTDDVIPDNTVNNTTGIEIDDAMLKDPWIAKIKEKIEELLEQKSFYEDNLARVIAEIERTNDEDVLKRLEAQKQELEQIIEYLNETLATLENLLITFIEQYRILHGETPS